MDHKVSISADRSFHMDRGRLVCNGCGGYFSNLVLFENHNHHDEDGEHVIPTRSGPKTDHITFNSYSNEEMLAAFHSMPELEGCWIENGQYHCCQCGKFFSNPYILFSHKILHPKDRKLVKIGASVKTQTGKRGKSRIGTSKYACAISDINIERDDREVAAKRVHYSVTIDNTKSLHIPQSGLVQHSQDTLAVAGSSNDLELCVKVEATHVANDTDCFRNEATTDAKEDQHEKNMTAGAHPVYKVEGEHTGWKDYVTMNDQPLTPTPKGGQLVPDNTKHDGIGNAHTTRLSNKKGLVFTDLDKNGMMKVFRKLPGLGKCTITQDGTFKCDKCDRAMDDPYTLFIHRLMHILKKQKPGGSRNLESRIAFYNLPGLENCKVDGGKYHCDACVEKFDNPYLLFTHKMLHDTLDSPTSSVKSNSSDSPFENIFNNGYLDQCKLVDGRYLCDECDRMYMNPYLMLNHKLLHDKDKAVAASSEQADSLDFATSTCPDSNARDITVLRLNIGNERNSDVCYECTVCQLQFKSEDSLANHIEKHVKQEQPEEEMTSGVSEETGDTAIVVNSEVSPPSPVPHSSSGVHVKMSMQITPKLEGKIDNLNVTLGDHHMSPNQPHIPLSLKHAVINLKRLDLSPSDVVIVSDHPKAYLQ